MNVGLSFKTVPFIGTMNFWDNIADFSINIGTKKFKMAALVLNSVDIPIVGQNDIVVADVKYDVYSLNSFA